MNTSDEPSDTTTWSILMVDDDEDDYLLVRTMLAEMQNGRFRLEWAGSYEAGKQALSTKLYDAVLMDYDLGMHTGLELIRQANSAGYSGAFILFTGRGSREVDLEAMHAGASMYLTKGEVSPLMLERGIRYAIERKRYQASLLQNEEALRKANEELRQELRKRAALESAATNQGEKLQQMLDRQRLLAEAAAELLAGKDPIEQLEALFQQVSNSLGLEVYVQYNVDGSGDHLELGSLGGFPPQYHKLLSRLEFGQAVCGTVAQTRQPIYVNDVQLSEDRKVRLIRSLGIGTYACHPLMVDGELLGTLSFGSRSLSRFEPETIDLLKTFCSMVAHALARQKQDRAAQAGAVQAQKTAEVEPLGESDPACIDCLSGGDEMGALVRSLDWSQTSLGPVSTWPASLRTAVNICLNSRFPILLWWGRDLTMLYNDAYRPILGSKKHPEALGQRGSECWPEIWHIIGPMLEGVLEKGQPTWSEDQLLILDRNVFPEECYFTFSYSPIMEDGKQTVGVFTAVTETTRQVISERRMWTLQQLTLETSTLHNFTATGAAAVSCLAANPADIPFALLYLRESEGHPLKLMGTVGLEGCASTPDEDGESAGWPFKESLRPGQPLMVDDASQYLTGLDVKVHTYPARSALVLPVTRSSQEAPYGWLVCGLSPIRPFDESYQSFLNLVAGQIAAALANAQALEDEYRRAEELARLNRAKTEFFSNISHEFRTPLTLMLGPIRDVLSAPNRASLERTELEMMHRNGQRLLKLINTLLDFSRLEAKRMEAVFEPVDLALLTADLASVFRSAIESAGLCLHIDCPPLPAPAYVDRDMWEKIVLNLMSNALKYTFSGEIRVRLQAVDGRIELSVSDTGVGVDAEDLEHLFERFYRGRATHSRSQEGSGIGLSLVKELAALHGGDTAVESELGVGSTFRVSIPAGKDHLPTKRVGAAHTQSSTTLGAAPYLDEAMRWLPEARTAHNPVPKVNPELAGSLGGYDDLGRIKLTKPAFILVVDDNADMREYLERLLAPFGRVKAVSDGLAALEAVQAERPDLVLSDIMMPGIDGLRLLQELRQDPTTAEIPVILLSARAGEEARVQGLEAGADDYMVKPFTARELQARVEARLAIKELRDSTEQRIRAVMSELEQSNKELEDFAFIASHDLQEPLRKIEAFAGQLAGRAGSRLSPTERDYLERLQSAAARMRKIITDLLVLSRIVSGGNPFTRVDLNKVVGQVLEDLEQRMKQSNGQVQVERLPVVMADETQMHQLFQNLIGNALKFTRPGTAPDVKVWVRSLPNQQVEICVEDNGTGFDMEQASRLFQPFQRLHGRSEYEGTGIGLSICRKIVERHGGKIRGEGRLGEGSRFIVQLAVKGETEKVG